MVAVASLEWQDVMNSNFSENPARTAWREAVATVADRAKAALPEANDRIEKAVAIVLAGDVELPLRARPRSPARAMAPRNTLW